MATSIYRYSPIKSIEQLDEALTYITEECEDLSLKIFNEKLPINTLKVFAHYPEEYEFLLKHIQGLGPKAAFSSDTNYYSEVSKNVAGHDIKYLGVRVVDPYRLQVGCGDFEIANFEEMKEQFADKTDYVRTLSEDMIEIWHPDFDVLGYVVPPFNG